MCMTSDTVIMRITSVELAKRISSDICTIFSGETESRYNLFSVYVLDTHVWRTCELFFDQYQSWTSANCVWMVILGFE